MKKESKRKMKKIMRKMIIIIMRKNKKMKMTSCGAEKRFHEAPKCFT